MSKTALALILLTCATSQVLAQGGPPLLTDDPDPVENGHWEINLLASLQSSVGQQSFELPHVDINYGWGDSIQLKYETGLAAVAVGSSALRFGWEDSLFGVKFQPLS